MPITLVTGAPRAGKTLWVMAELDKAVKAGRPVYARIDGFCLPGGQQLEEGTDWRSLPDGAVVAIDECHQWWPASGGTGRTTNEQIVQLDEHGHRGFDFYLMSQRHKKVHFQVRENVSDHVHVIRSSGFERASLFRWGSVQDDPDDRQVRDLADVETWGYEKRLYPFYKSATLHTVKRRWPKKIVFAALACTVLFGLVVMKVTSGDGMLSSIVVGGESAGVLAAGLGGGGAHSEARAAPTAPVVVSDGLYEWAYAQVVPDVFGCISSARACRCYNGQGLPLDLSDFECRMASERPLPIRLFGGDSNGYPG